MIAVRIRIFDRCMQVSLISYTICVQLTYYLSPGSGAGTADATAVFGDAHASAAVSQLDDFSLHNVKMQTKNVSQYQLVFMIKSGKLIPLVLTRRPFQPMVVQCASA